MKFSQLIDYNVKNIFLKKSCTQCGGETSRRPFCEKLKLSIFLDQWSKILLNLFSLHAAMKAIDVCLS